MLAGISSHHEVNAALLSAAASWAAEVPGCAPLLCAWRGGGAGVTSAAGGGLRPAISELSVPLPASGHQLPNAEVGAADARAAPLPRSTRSPTKLGSSAAERLPANSRPACQPGISLRAGSDTKPIERYDGQQDYMTLSALARVKPVLALNGHVKVFY